MKIKKSSISHYGDTFEPMVAAYVQELRSWKEHMKRVEEDEANGVADGHAPYPRPTSQPEIIASLNADGNPDYEIVDDSPSADQILALQKSKLAAEVASTEAAALEKSYPVNRRRLVEIKSRGVVQRDEARKSIFIAQYNNMVQKVAALQAELSKTVDLSTGRSLKKIEMSTDEPPAPITTDLVDAATAAKGVAEFKDLNDERSAMEKILMDPETLAAHGRPDDDQAIVDAVTAYSNAVDKIQLWAAEQLDAIEDLTSETIGSWQMPAINH